MAHSLSAKKRVRQNLKRRALNRMRMTTLRNKLRNCREAFQRGTLQEAEQACLAACTALDREANRRTIHRNQAARRKSRIVRHLNALRAKPATA